MIIGPLEFEAKWLKTENALVDSLSQKKWVFPTFFILYIISAYVLFALWTEASFPAWSRFNIVQDRLWAAYVLLSLSFIPLFIKPLRNQSIYLFVALSTSWLLPVYKMGALSFMAFLPLLYVLFGALIIRSSKGYRWLKVFVLFALYVAMVTVLTKDIVSNQTGSKLLLYFSNIHLDLLLLFFIGSIFNQHPFTLQIHLNPIQMFSPLPLPENTQLSINEVEYNKQFIRGLIELISAQLIFVLLMLAYKNDFFASSTNPFILYSFFLLVIVGAMKSVSALLWLYGIRSQPATYFFFLAKSPIEIWQRGSVFVADFLFNKIYFPLWKKFRSTLFSSLIVILAILGHLFIFHELLVKTWLRWQFGDLLFGSFGIREIKTWTIWLLTWLVLILIFSGFHKATKRWHHSSLFQWALVILTHLGCALVFPVVFYLSSVVAV